MTRLAWTCLLFLASVACAGDKGLPSAEVPNGLGVNIHFAGAHDEEVAAIAAAGFRFVRMDLGWDWVEKKQGEYNFQAFDELVDSLSKHGVRALFILDYGNPLYDGGVAPHTDEGRAAFARYAKAAAGRFRGKGVLWEVWNEPNGGFWKPKPNIQDYVALAAVACKAVHEADPDATVLGPALAGCDPGWLEAAFKEGLLEQIDVVSVHPYGSKKPEDAQASYEKVREEIAKHAPKGKAIPVVSGEWGYPSLGGMSVERQGEFLAREMLVNLANGIPLSIWYDWHDDGPDPKNAEHHFGTIGMDEKPKPAYVAMQTLSKELAGFTFAERMATESKEGWVLRFQNGDASRWVVWTTGKPHTLQVAVPTPKAAVFTINGERAEADARDGKVEVEATSAVKYVEPLPR